MTRRTQRKNPGLGAALSASLALHLVFFFVLALSGRHVLSVPPEQICYVDVVNLPVASPQAGAPTSSALSPSPAAPEPSSPLPSPAPAKGAKQPDMALPGQTKKRPGEKEEGEEDIAEKINQLRKSAERRREEQALEAALRNLKNRPTAAAPEKKGIPGGTGTQAGSDYASYIQSRLRDAFRQTIAHQTGNPVVVVRLAIDRFGNVTDYRIERSSGDRLFENAVAQAVAVARKTFPAPPDGRDFSYGFVFRPQGVETR